MGHTDEAFRAMEAVMEKKRKPKPMPRLKPCPFCGNQPHVAQALDELGRISIWCPDSLGCLGASTRFLTPESAAEAWNTRRGGKRAKR